MPAAHHGAEGGRGCDPGSVSGFRVYLVETSGSFLEVACFLHFSHIQNHLADAEVQLLANETSIRIEKQQFCGVRTWK